MKKIFLFRSSLNLENYTFPVLLNKIFIAALVNSGAAFFVPELKFEI